MRARLGTALTTAITMGMGFIVILGLIIGDGLGGASDSGDSLPLREISAFFLQMVTVVIALTVIIGILNLIGVHVRRVGRREGGGVYSMILLISFTLVLMVYAIERDSDSQEGSTALLSSVQLSIESALAGLLFFALVYGAYRMLRERVTWTGLLFIGVLLVVLLGALPFSELEFMVDARDWLLETPVSAGARGILLGVALATIVTGVRVLIGQDRSYRE